MSDQTPPAGAAPEATAPPQSNGAPAASTGTDQVSDAEIEQFLDSDLPAGDSLPRAATEKARKAAARYREKHRDLDTFIREMGGRERVERLIKATQTPEGLASIWYEAGRALGKDQKSLEEFLVGQIAERGGKVPGEGDDDDDDLDRPMTKREAAEYVRQQLEAEVKGPLSQQRARDLATAGAKVIHDTLENLGVKDDADKRAVMRFAGDFLPEAGSPNEFDVTVIADAVAKAKQAHDDEAERLTKAYLERKRQSDEVPGGLGTASGAPTITLPKEPQSSKEVSKMLREMYADQ